MHTHNSSKRSITGILTTDWFTGEILIYAPFSFSSPSQTASISCLALGNYGSGWLIIGFGNRTSAEVTGSEPVHCLQDQIRQGHTSHAASEVMTKGHLPLINCSIVSSLWERYLLSIHTGSQVSMVRGGGGGRGVDAWVMTTTAP